MNLISENRVTYFHLESNFNLDVIKSIIDSIISSRFLLLNPKAGLILIVLLVTRLCLWVQKR